VIGLGVQRVGDEQDTLKGSQLRGHLIDQRRERGVE
jgi:hypothetical protein